MADWGKSAVPGDKITEIAPPLGGSNSKPIGCYSTGPTFDLTPKDNSTHHCMDVLPSPYGPPYGKPSGG